MNPKPVESILYLIPLPIAENSAAAALSPQYQEIVKNIKHFVAENARTLRRYLSSLKLGIDISSLEIAEINAEKGTHDALSLLRNVVNGQPIGVASEAGMPGIADPGAFAVAWAHKNQIKVHALTGESSIFLALAASGLNGQQFTFHGYPPIKDPELSQFLSKILQHTVKTGYTQILIETPYRTDRLLKSISETGYGNVLLSVASDIHGPEEYCVTQSIDSWKKHPKTMGKKPTVFLLGREWAV